MPAQEPPQFSLSLKSISTTEGQPVAFEARVTGDPEPTVTWFRDNIDVSKCPDYDITTKDGVCCLKIEEAFPEDAGKFKVVAENAIGKASSTANLVVEELKEAPEFKKRLDNYEVQEGDRVEMETYISGYPRPMVRWYHNGEEIKSSIDVNITQTGNTNKLTIPEVFEEDAGEYICKAENAAGVAQSIAELTVNRLVSQKATVAVKSKDDEAAPEKISKKPETSQLDGPAASKPKVSPAISSNLAMFEKAPPAGLPKSMSPSPKKTPPAPPPEKTPVTASEESPKKTPPAPPAGGPPKMAPPAPPKKSQQNVEPPKVTPPVPPKKVPAPQIVEPPKTTPMSPPKQTTPIETKVPPPVQTKVTQAVQPKVTPPVQPKVTPPVQPKVAPPVQPKVAPPVQQKVMPPSNVAPTFSKLLQDVTCDEGARVELSCCVTGKPEPYIKWTREGDRIEPSVDFEILYKNGDANLTIPEVFVDDAGRFTCSASNIEGERSTSCLLRVKAAEIPEMKGMQIRQTSEGIRHSDQRNLLAPCFTKPLQPVKLVEGMRARFECQVEGYPVPEIVWLMKGLPIAHGYRFIVKHNEQTGQCSLEITMALRDDIGEFTCIAKNQAGQTTTTAPLLPEATYNHWFKQQELERQKKEREEQQLAYAMEMERQNYMASQQPQMGLISPEPEEAPVNPFEKRLMSEVAFRERSMSQDRISLPDKDQGVKLSPFERRLMTEVSYRERLTGDQDLERAHLAVDKDYMVSPFESRLAQEISFRDQSLNVEDVDYAAVPAVSPVAFDIEVFEARLLKGSEFGTKDGTMTETDTETEFTESEMETDTDMLSAPRFVKEMKNIQQMEGSSITLSCRVSGRPRPMIQWFKDGHILRKSQRMEVRQTEGFCSLRIDIGLPSDSGHYTVLAANTAGKAVCSSRVVIKGSKGDDKPQHMKGVMGARVRVESKVYNMPHRGFIEGEVKEKYYRPSFKEIPQDLTVREGKVARFNCRVTGRPPPDFIWLLNGQPVRLDRNHHMIINEGGINSLVIYYTSPKDAGTYTCTARNRAGENQFCVNLNVDAKESRVAPSFIDRIQNVAVKVNESVTMTCKVAGTPTPTVSWQKDGHFIHPDDTHYITEVKDGVCTLHINDVQRSDSAWYSCTAFNSAGRTSCRAKLLAQVDKRPSSEPRPLIIPKRSPILPVITDTTPILPSYVQPERYSDEEDKHKAEAPKIEVKLHNITSNEGSTVAFKCRVSPSNDPTLHVEWFKDGKPIKSGSRYITTSEFGICSLKINGIFPEDAGHITCLITNESGTCQTSAVLTCLAKGAVILETQLPEEMQGIQKTLAYEQALREGTLSTEDEASEEDEHAEPSFVKIPEGVECVEGGPARFSCRLTGYPLPRVSWYKDNVQLISSSRIKISFDGLHHLEIPKTRPYDAGEIRVEAKNKYGSANHITRLNVLRREDFNIQLRPSSREEQTKHQVQFEEQRLAAKIGKPLTEQDRLVPAHAVKQEVIKEEFKPAERAPVEAEPIQVAEMAPPQESLPEQQPITQLPAFTLELLDQVAVEGTPVVLETRFAGDCTVKWFKDGKDAHVNPDFSITVAETYSTLTIVESFTDDAGVYSVELTNSAGTVKSAAELFIKEVVIENDTGEPEVKETAPKVSSFPQDAIVGTCGEPIKIVIKIESEPKSQVTWYKGNQKLVPTIRQKMIEDDNVFTLLILDAKSEDSGSYYCEATNKCGVCRTEIKVVVPAPTGAPELITPMQDVEVEEGCPIEIECHAVSKSEPIVTWFLDKAIIKPSKYFQMFYEDGVAKLYINEVFPEDEGQYSCEVVNEFGKVGSSARLRVKGMFYDAEYYPS